MAKEADESGSKKNPKKAWEDPNVVSIIRGWHSAHYIFRGNYRQLKRALDELAKPEVALKIWTDDEQLEMISLQIIRLLHNYLAAAYTLKDHTYKVREIYEDTRFLEEYEAKKREAFADSPLSQFIQRFRNYTLHAGLPFTSTEMNLGSGETSIHLDVIQLRASRYFTGKTRDFF